MRLGAQSKFAGVRAATRVLTLVGVFKGPALAELSSVCSSGDIPDMQHPGFCGVGYRGFGK